MLSKIIGDFRVQLVLLLVIVSMGIGLKVTYNLYQSQVALTDSLKRDLDAETKKYVDSIKERTDLERDIAQKSAMILVLNRKFNTSKESAQSRTSDVERVLKLSDHTEIEQQINLKFSELQRGVECLTGKSSSCLP